MKNLGYIASEITKGKHLEENLLKYGKGLASLYNGLAYIKMAMNYYTILSMIKDNEINDELFLEMYMTDSSYIFTESSSSENIIQKIELNEEEYNKLI